MGHAQIGLLQGLNLKFATRVKKDKNKRPLFQEHVTIATVVTSAWEKNLVVAQIELISNNPKTTPDHPEMNRADGRPMEVTRHVGVNSCARSKRERKVQNVYFKLVSP